MYRRGPDVLTGFCRLHGVRHAMKIRVARQACCAADDQVGPLDTVYRVEANASLSDLIKEIAQSGFLHFSSTHDRITGEFDGKRLVEVCAPGCPTPKFLFS